jgi:hypothetical protein
MWSSDDKYENEFVVIQGWRIYGIRVNYSEVEGSNEYTDRFHLTSVKMEELPSTVGPFLRWKTNWDRTLSEKELLQIALHWLGTGGQYHSVGDIHIVCVWPVYLFLFWSLTKNGGSIPAGSTDVGNFACSWSTAVSSAWRQSSPSKPSTKRLSFQEHLGWGGVHFIVLHILTFICSSHFCTVSVCLKYNTKLCFACTSMTGTLHQSSALTWIRNDE